MRPLTASSCSCWSSCRVCCRSWFPSLQSLEPHASRKLFYSQFTVVYCVVASYAKRHQILQLVPAAPPTRDYVVRRQAARVIAVGDTEPDLAMFQVADRSYAPAHTQVRELAALLGCKIAAGVFQNGFLEIAEDILRSENIEPSTLQKPVFEIPIRNRLLLDLLGEADLSDRQKLKRTVFDVKRLKEVFS